MEMNVNNNVGCLNIQSPESNKWKDYAKYVTCDVNAHIICGDCLFLLISVPGKGFLPLYSPSLSLQTLESSLLSSY